MFPLIRSSLTYSVSNGTGKDTTDSKNSKPLHFDNFSIKVLYNTNNILMGKIITNIFVKNIYRWMCVLEIWNGSYNVGVMKILKLIQNHLSLKDYAQKVFNPKTIFLVCMISAFMQGTL